MQDQLHKKDRSNPCIKA